MVHEDLTNYDSHFAFGANWASYAHLISEVEIEEAVGALRRLAASEDLRGKRFLDIGCGSGIHSLAALRLGAAGVLAIDLDPNSVATTKSVLHHYAPDAHFQVALASVLDINPGTWGQFEVVYSWGVLHHTGNLKMALCKAAAMVQDDGRFMFALYRRTWMCPLWKIEKKWYSKASPDAQRMAQRVYLAWFRFVGRRFFDVDKYIEEYRLNRGMDFNHDIHDWLGGYPYESILPDEVEHLMGRLGFVNGWYVSGKAKRGKSHGLLGAGCDEYVYVKRPLELSTVA